MQPGESALPGKRTGRRQISKPPTVDAEGPLSVGRGPSIRLHAAEARQFYYLAGFIRRILL